MRIIMNRQTDVVIVGTGAAGLFCALKLPTQYKVLMLTKDEVDQSDSFLAQGGMCMLRGEEDYDSYFEDTMKAGHYENNKASVDVMIRSSNQIAQDLIGYGVDFERDGDELAFTREGGHSRPRILFHEDITGKEITSKLLARAQERENITILDHTMMLDIICGEDGCEGLVIRVDTGIDHRDAAARTGIACGPRRAGADLHGRCSHVGIRRLVLIDDHRHIPGLKNDLLNAGDSPDLFDLAVFDVGGDQVGGKRQIPHDVELFAGRRLDLPRHAVLLRLQLIAVGVHGRVGGDVRRAVKLHRGSLVQNDGYTDNVAVRVCGRIFFFFTFRSFCEHFRADVFRLLELQTLRPAFRSSRAGRDQESRQHRQNQKQAEHTAQIALLHSFPSFCIFVLPHSFCPARKDILEYLHRNPQNSIFFH